VEKEKKKIKKVGILRGMAGDQYESSLKRGGQLISHILENLKNKYKPVDIFVDRNYIWHYNGVPVNPGDLVRKVDVVWNTSHPSLSNVLESLSIPSVGVSNFSSMLEKNREMLREHAKKIGVNMSRHILIPLYQKDFDGPKDKFIIKKAKEIFEKFGAPWIVKSLTPDISMGVHLAKNYSELIGAIADGVNHKKSILVEEFIIGQSASFHSVPSFRGEDIYVFFPKSLVSAEKEKISGTVKDLHNHVDAKHYLKSDWVLHPRGNLFLTGIDLHPNFNKESHLEKSCASVGADMHHLVEHILENALDSR